MERLNRMVTQASNLRTKDSPRAMMDKHLCPRILFHLSTICRTFDHALFEGTYALPKLDIGLVLQVSKWKGDRAEKE